VLLFVELTWKANGVAMALARLVGGFVAFPLVFVIVGQQ